MHARYVYAGAIALVAAITSIAYHFAAVEQPHVAQSRGAATPTATPPTVEAPGAPMAAASADAGGKQPAGELKPIYFRNPMGLPDTSPVPKKDWMGMDYIAVYAGDEPADRSTVKVSLEKVQRAGVRSEPAEMRKMTFPVRAPGTAKPDERTFRKITLRADGFIEKLYANEHGRHVKAGEPLFRVFSQEMQRALIDYRLGQSETRGRSALILAEQRLHNYDIPQAAIDEARTSAALPGSFDWPSPVSGVIMEKMAVEGQMAKMGEELFMIGSLSSIWVITDVPEQDAAAIKVGAPAVVRFRALPNETFEGKVTFILHELDHTARTIKARIEVANPHHNIRHEMYADVEIDAGSGDEQRLAVPASALIDSGARQVVIVDKGEGRFEPRPVSTGMRTGQFVEITKGLSAGEKVVISANFLIDAESNIKAALDAFAPDAKPNDGAKP